MNSSARVRRLTLVWWSNTGGTQALAMAAQAGAREALVQAEVALEIQALRCDQANVESVVQSDGLILASPECLGSVAGPMKTFLDQCYYPLLGQIEGRAWSALICAGTDGEGALRLIRRVTTGWGLREAVPSVVVRSGEQHPQEIQGPTNLLPADLHRARTLGATLAAGLAIGLW